MEDIRKINVEKCHPDRYNANSTVRKGGLDFLDSGLASSEGRVD